MWSSSGTSPIEAMLFWASNLTTLQNHLVLYSARVAFRRIVAASVPRSTRSRQRQLVRVAWSAASVTRRSSHPSVSPALPFLFAGARPLALSRIAASPSASAQASHESREVALVARPGALLAATFLLCTRGLHTEAISW